MYGAIIKAEFKQPIPVSSLFQDYQKAQIINQIMLFFVWESALMLLGR